jgi:hypothetical protein
MKVNPECFKKSVKHDYKNLIELTVGIVAIIGIFTAYGEKIAAAGNDVLSLIGSVCTAYNILCFLFITIASIAMLITIYSQKENEILICESGFEYGLYLYSCIAFIAGIVITSIYAIASYANTLKLVCPSGFWRDCSYISSGSAYPSPLIPFATWVVSLALLSPLAVAYARCKMDEVAE